MATALKYEEMDQNESNELASKNAVFPLFVSTVLGSSVSLGVLTLITLLGAGLGLSFFDFENGTEITTLKLIGATLAVVIGLAVSYFSGGLVAAQTHSHNVKRRNLLGLLVWSITTSVLVIGPGNKLATAVGGILATSGAAAGSAVGVGAAFTELEKLNPRIVSDMQIFEGKVVSYLTMDKNQGTLPENTAKKATRDAAKVTRDPAVKEAMHDVRVKVAQGSLALFGALLLSAFASLFGTRFAKKFEPME